jgi:hypothetical protein
MKSKLLILVSFLVPMMVFAQKNVVPANQITALNLKLPEGSKQDKRFLSTVAAGTLLEAEVMEPTIKLGATEVYMLPSTAKSGFDRNILVKELEKSGFEIIPTDDELISWLVKGPEAFLIYFSMDKEETNFYLARSNAIPNAVSQSSDQNPNLTTPPYIPPLPPARTKTSNSRIQQIPSKFPASSQNQAMQNPSAALFSGFQFTTSNLGDGWTSDLVAMSRYNKFAIGPNDLNCSWQNGGSQMTQRYDSFTGAYAGAKIATSSATFSFSGKIYSSIHNGTTGTVGAMNTFQQEYKGNSTISNWNVTLTNRYQGKNQQLDAHFQAVKGGRLLYLNNRAGEEYMLVRIC